MKKTTKQGAIFCGAFLAFSIASEFPKIINPTPLSKARERVLIKAVSFGVILIGTEILAKE